jgi:penicillin-binding protein 1A
VLLRAGIDNVVNTARRMGIKSPIPRVPSIALGVADISLMEMVKAYCTFPNGGKAVEPIAITRIEDANGTVIWNAKKRTTAKRAFTRQTAYYMTEMLKGVVNEGTASRIRYTYNLKGEIAGKTGTTQSQADGWFIGYTPGLVAGAWVGAESPLVHFNSTTYGQGAHMALPIWALFMRKCKADQQCGPYVNGSFNFGSDLYGMPQCESFIEEDDTVFDKIKSWFGGKKDKNGKEEKRPEKAEAKKKGWFKGLFGK